jgi:hypothetical protein
MFCKFCGREIPEKLTSVGFCPFCGKTLTEADRPALEISRTDEQPSQAELVAGAANEKSSRTKQILAILGALLLFVGVFLPIMSMPIVGSLNYFHNGQGDGTIVLILAVISIILAITRRFRGLWVTGLCSVGLLLFALVNFLIRMAQLRDQMQTDLADNPFKGLADVAINSVQLQWGWAVLMLGGVLIVVAAALPGPTPAIPQQLSGARTTAKWIGASIAAFILLLGVASLLNTNQPVENNPTVQRTAPTPSGTVTSQRPQAENIPPGYPYFSDGTHVVGQDVSAGTYRTRSGSPGCYYSRLSGFSGTLGDIISNENTDAPAVVTISPNDKGFASRGCGIWTQDLSAITSSRTTFGDGIYIIGADIQPGTYRNDGQQGCYYERLSGFGGILGETIANENTDSPAVVTISATDTGFKSARCGIWSLISGAQPSSDREITSSESEQSLNSGALPSPNSTSETQSGQLQNSLSTDATQLRSMAVSRGYQPIGNTWLVVADSEGNKILIQQAACKNVADGQCQKLFIAFNDRFLGTDTFQPSWAVHDVAQERVGSFSAVYENHSDPSRKSPPVKVIYTWDGQKLTASGTPPTRASSPTSIANR